MNQPSRSASVERKDSYNKDPRLDNPSNGNRDDRYKSRSPSMKRSMERRDRSRSPPLKVPGNVLYVGNLNRRLGENEVQEKFEKYGKIQSIQMVRDPFTNESRGFAFVEYVNVDDATEALENLDQKEFDGRRMKVERSKRGRGYQKTPGEYLGHFKSHNKQRSPSPYYKRRQSRGPGGEGGRRSRDRHSRERSPRGRPSRNPYPRDRYSRSRSRDRGADRKYRDDYRNRSRERSRERYRDPRDIRDTRDMRDSRDFRDNRSGRDSRYGRDNRDPRDNRDNGYRTRVRDRSRSRG